MSSKLPEANHVDTAPSGSSTGATAYTPTSNLPTMKSDHIDCLSHRPLDFELKGLFSENVAAKIWRVAKSHLEKDVS
jgi:hypothetical protein